MVRKRGKSLLSLLLSAIMVVVLIQGPLAGMAVSYPETDKPAGAEQAYYKYPFQNPTLTDTERVADLVSRLTLDEKVSLMHQFSAAIIRLGVPSFRTGSEGLHGVSWLGYATIFPQGTGLSTTWNKNLMLDVGRVVGEEMRAYNSQNSRFNGVDVWSPVVDLNRDPRAGRASEGMGEDPYLTGQISSYYGVGMKGTDNDFYYMTIPTLKHFAAYGQEASRTGYSANTSPRNLFEYYFKAFEPAIRSSAVNSIMTSYNLVAGKPIMTDKHLMDNLYGEWVDGGYGDGRFFVVTDAGSPSNLYGSNSYYPNSAVGQAASQGDSLINGVGAMTYSDTQTPPERLMIYEALARGFINEDTLTEASRAVLMVRCHAGDLDADPINPYKELNKDNALVFPDNAADHEHSEISRQTAREGVVLLKNEGNVLPLSKDAKVSLTGPLSTENSTDFYAGTYPYVTYILDEVQKKIGQPANLLFSRGVDIVAFKSLATGTYESVNGKYLTAGAAANNAISATGTDSADTAAQFMYFQYPHNNGTMKSVKFENRAANTGFLNTSLHFNNRAPGYQGVDRATQQWSTDSIVSVWNQGTKDADGNPIVRISSYSGTGRPSTSNYIQVNNVSGTVNRSGNNSTANNAADFAMVVIQDAVEKAKADAAASQVSVVCVGDQPHLDSRETIDRPSSDLNGDGAIALAAPQLELIQAVASVNPNTVVVLVGSYPFDMSAVQANPNVKGILYTSHAGQDLGTAVADALFGDYAPAGRLNQTWYAGTSSLPAISDYDIIKGGRTYLYHKADDVTYPFGYGLTYASFGYASSGAPAAEVANTSKAPLEFKVDVTNTSATASDQVLELYVKYAGSSLLERPLKQLCGFERVHFAAGETKPVGFSVPMSELAIWDVSRDTYFVEPGTYTFMAGTSSADADIKCSWTVTVTGAPIPPRDLTKVTSAINWDDYSFTGTSADITPLSAQEDDTYSLNVAKANSWVVYKNADFSSNPAGIVMRASNSGSAAALANVYKGDPANGGVLAGTVSIPATGSLQTYVNVGAAMEFGGGLGDLYIVFPQNNVQIKWFKLGAVPALSAASIQINTFHYNSNANTSLTRFHVQLDPVIYLQGASLMVEAVVDAAEAALSTPVWSVAGPDGQPTELATVSQSGQLTATGTTAGNVVVAVTFETSAGPVSASKTVEIQNQASDGVEAIVLRSGSDYRPSELGWGNGDYTESNQFSDFGAIYKKEGTLTVSAVTYPNNLATARAVTFELTDLTGEPTDLAVLSNPGYAGYVQGTGTGTGYTGNTYRAYNCVIQATGAGNGWVLLTGTAQNGMKASTKIFIQNQGLRNAYETRYEAELYDERGTVEGGDGFTSVHVDNVHGDDVGLQVNGFKNGNWVVYKDVDFAEGGDLEMVLRYMKITSAVSGIKIMLDNPNTGTLLGTARVRGDDDRAYDWHNVTVQLGLVSGVHDLYLVVETTPPNNNDLNGTYNLIPGLCDLGISWFSIRPTTALFKIDTGKVTTLVEDCAAYLNVYVDKAYDGAAVEFLGVTGVIRNGMARLYIPGELVNASLNGYAEVRVTYGDFTATKGIAVKRPENLWAPAVGLSTDGKLQVVFSADIGGAITCALGKVAVGGKVATVDYAPEGDVTFQLKGVKYPELFPSYSFTFTITYEAEIEEPEPEFTTQVLYNYENADGLFQDDATYWPAGNNNSIVTDPTNASNHVLKYEWANGTLKSNLTLYKPLELGSSAKKRVLKARVYIVPASAPGSVELYGKMDNVNKAGAAVTETGKWVDLYSDEIAPGANVTEIGFVIRGAQAATVVYIDDIVMLQYEN